MKKTAVDLTVSRPFLEAVFQKYHFNPEDKEQFYSVAKEVEEAVRGQAGFWSSQAEDVQSGMAIVAMTLGEQVDVLQETYRAAGDLTACYMIETIAGELLLTAYARYNEWAKQKIGLHVERYYFFGAEETYPLEEMKKALEELGTEEVCCNRACCLTPKKSVVFLAKLTENENVQCAGICVNCVRKDCPNRMTEKEKEGEIRWPDLTGRALPYGYMRIWGKGQEIRK